MKDLILEYIEKKTELIELRDKIKEETGVNLIELADYIQVNENIEILAAILDVEIKTEMLNRDTKEKYFYIKDTRILEV